MRGYMGFGLLWALRGPRLARRAPAEIPAARDSHQERGCRGTPQGVQVAGGREVLTRCGAKKV